MIRPAGRAAALLLAFTPVMAPAATHNFSVTDFDRIRIAGPYVVKLRTGAGSSASASGDQAALDRLRVEVQGGTLTISSDRDYWGGTGRSGGAVTVDVATRTLSAATLSGSGSLAVDRLKGERFNLVVTGSGGATLGAVDIDRLTISATGSGDIAIAGKAAQARVILQGSGRIAAEKLSVADADLALTGAGGIALAATRSAKITASGTGDVVVTGPAACTVRRSGSGEVTCGAGGRP